MRSREEMLEQLRKAVESGFDAIARVNLQIELLMDIRDLLTPKKEIKEKNPPYDKSLEDKK